MAGEPAWCCTAAGATGGAPRCRRSPACLLRLWEDCHHPVQQPVVVADQGRQVGQALRRRDRLCPAHSLLQKLHARWAGTRRAGRGRRSTSAAPQAPQQLVKPNTGGGGAAQPACTGAANAAGAADAATHPTEQVLQVSHASRASA